MLPQQRSLENLNLEDYSNINFHTLENIVSYEITHLPQSLGIYRDISYHLIRQIEQLFAFTRPTWPQNGRNRFKRNMAKVSEHSLLQGTTKYSPPGHNF